MQSTHPAEDVLMEESAGLLRNLSEDATIESIVKTSKDLESARYKSTH